MDFEDEDDATDFLGAKLTKVQSSGQIVMTQVGLSDRSIDAHGFESVKITPRFTPCLNAPLTKYLYVLVCYDDKRRNQTSRLRKVTSYQDFGGS